jgi:DAK2 domain fusion protein YloV
LAKSIADQGEVNAAQLAAGLQNGVDTAYKAVVKPVEGTILTVAKEAAKHAAVIARRNIDVLELMVEVLSKAKEALAKTPDQLPVLKQVGVVDAGGQGLVCIYEGFVASLQGKGSLQHSTPINPPGTNNNTVAESIRKPASTLHNQAVHMPRSAQAQLSTEDIEFGYCTEFMIQLVEGKSAEWVFDELGFRTELEKHGDSVLVVADDDLVKVHLHAELPGDVLTLAQRYGDLIKIKIENMREQHTHLLVEDADVEEASRHGQDSYRSGTSAGGALQASQATTSIASADDSASSSSDVPFGFVAVSMGGGIAAILESLGADVVLSGGQTMNPSTEDIVNAVQQVPARTVFVLPNNSNIIMAAQQAKDLVDKEVIVIPSKTIPQGMSALLAFQDQADTGKNTDAMLKAIAGVQSGQVTYAVRDSQIDGLDIKQGDYLGIHNNKIVTSTPSLGQTCQALLDSMTSEGGEIITILAGEDAETDTTNELVDWLGQEYPNAEVEVHHGGQPLYYYIFAVE